MLKDEEVPVTIYGRKFTIKIEGFLSLETITLANAVNERMLALADERRVYDSAKVAILVALEYAAEAQKLKEKEKNLGGAEERKIDSMIVELQKSVEGQP